VVCHITGVCLDQAHGVPAPLVLDWPTEPRPVLGGVLAAKVGHLAPGAWRHLMCGVLKCAPGGGYSQTRFITAAVCCVPALRECGCRWFILNKPLSQKRRAVRLAAFRPPRVVFVLGLVSLINSLTSGKKKVFTSSLQKVFAPRGRRPDLLKWDLPAGEGGIKSARKSRADPLFMSSIYPPAAPSHRDGS